jgi:hypothetical protein
VRTWLEPDDDRGRQTLLRSPACAGYWSHRCSRRRRVCDGHCRRGAWERGRKGELGGDALIQRRSEGEGDSPHGATSAPTEWCSHFRKRLAPRDPRWASLLSRRRCSIELLRGWRCKLDWHPRSLRVLRRATPADGPLDRRPLEGKQERDEVLPRRRHRRRPGLVLLDLLQAHSAEYTAEALPREVNQDEETEDPTDQAG